MAHAAVLRILYRQEPDGWWADSPDVGNWTLAGDTYDQVREPAVEGAAFALAAEGEDRGEGFDEARFDGVELQHFVLTQ